MRQVAGLPALRLQRTMTEAQMKAMVEGFTAQNPVRRMGSPDDIATAVLFLASSASLGHFDDEYGPGAGAKDFFGHRAECRALEAGATMR